MKSLVFYLTTVGIPTKIIYILTPVANPVTHRQILYNVALIRIRNTVERTIEVCGNECSLSYGMRHRHWTCFNSCSRSIMHIARNIHEPEHLLLYDIAEQKLRRTNFSVIDRNQRNFRILLKAQNYGSDNWS